MIYEPDSKTVKYSNEKFDKYTLELLEVYFLWAH